MCVFITMRPYVLQICFMVVGVVAWRVELLEPLLDVAVVFLSPAVSVPMQSARASAETAAGFGFRALQG